MSDTESDRSDDNQRKRPPPSPKNKRATEEDDKEAEEKPVTFASLGVCKELCTACEQMKWSAASPIQVQSIPHALRGKDVIGLAQTGSGKTGAFALPVLQDLLGKPQAFHTLVLSPTRELASQIAEQFESLGKDIGVKCAVLVGGMDMTSQSLQIGKRPHILVGTPGRVVDHLENTKGFSLRQLKVLILDEADRLLNLDFEEEIDTILKVIPRERRTQLFSATMTSKVNKLQRACLRDPVKVEVASKYSTVKSLKQNYLFVPAKHKECYACYLLNELSASTIMMFTRTCEQTRKLALVARNLGFSAIPIHGQMSQPKRQGALNKFKAGERNILVATDVASRGLDIPSVDVVINFDVPMNSKDYVHRVGRTARAGRSGLAITLVTQYDVELYQKIERLIEKRLEKYPVEEEQCLVMLERVNEAQRIAASQMRDADAKKGGGFKRIRNDDVGEDDLSAIMGRKKYAFGDEKKGMKKTKQSGGARKDIKVAGVKNNNNSFEIQKTNDITCIITIHHLRQSLSPLSAVSSFVSYSPLVFPLSRLRILSRYRFYSPALNAAATSVPPPSLKLPHHLPLQLHLLFLRHHHHPPDSSSCVSSSPLPLSPASLSTVR